MWQTTRKPAGERPAPLVLGRQSLADSVEWRKLLFEPSPTNIAVRSRRVITPRRVKYIRDLAKLKEIPPDERAKLEKVAERYVFRVNDYYLGLINWDDPDDPIKQLIIPREEELTDWGRLDASNEQAVTVVRGVQHKYPHTVLLLCNEVCGAYCRYCFRKRLFRTRMTRSLTISQKDLSISPTTPT